MANNVLSGGAKTTDNGAMFEDRCFEAIENMFTTYGAQLKIIKKYSTAKTVKMASIEKDGVLKGYLGTQSSIFAYLDDNEYWESIANIEKPSLVLRKVWSKGLKPDIGILDLSDKESNGTMHIIESKYQIRSGSVDEKLQTSKYKLMLWKKLFRNIDVDVTYEYLLSFYFIDKRRDKDQVILYSDILDYLTLNHVPGKAEKFFPDKYNKKIKEVKTEITYSPNKNTPSEGITNGLNGKFNIEDYIGNL